MTEKDRLLRIREKKKQKRPKFKSQESWRYKRVKSSWRKPIGIDSKMRHHKRGWPKVVKVGYRSPKAVRGLTKNGMEEVLVHNVKEMEAVDNETQVARIASAVGMRKKIDMTNRADELDIKIINRPEEALTFAAISEISEELLLEEEEFEEEAEELRKKRKTLTAEELAALDRLEQELEEEKAEEKPKPKKKKPTKKEAPKKKPVKKEKEPEVTSEVTDEGIEVTYKGRTYTFEKDVLYGDLKSKRGIPVEVKREAARVRGFKTWDKI